MEEYEVRIELERLHGSLVYLTYINDTTIKIKLESNDRVFIYEIRDGKLDLLEEKP